MDCQYCLMFGTPANVVGDPMGYCAFSNVGGATEPFPSYGIDAGLPKGPQWVGIRYAPTDAPSKAPTHAPSHAPSAVPSTSPSVTPSGMPTTIPTGPSGCAAHAPPWPSGLQSIPAKAITGALNPNPVGHSNPETGGVDFDLCACVERCYFQRTTPTNTQDCVGVNWVPNSSGPGGTCTYFSSMFSLDNVLGPGVAVTIVPIGPFATRAPTARPSASPTAPTKAPSAASAPTASPTEEPTSAPTASPSEEPTSAPSDSPTSAPSTRSPTEAAPVCPFDAGATELELHDGTKLARPVSGGPFTLGAQRVELLLTPTAGFDASALSAAVVSGVGGYVGAPYTVEQGGTVRIELSAIGGVCSSACAGCACNPKDEDNYEDPYRPLVFFDAAAVDPNQPLASCPAFKSMLYYTERCDVSKYEYVTTAEGLAACMQAGEGGAGVTANGKLCGYGAPPYCVDCPEGGVCPGGFRLWPQPGFWLDGDVDAAARAAWHHPPAVDPCAFPATRCAGFSPELVQSSPECADGYSGDRCEEEAGSEGGRSTCDEGYTGYRCLDCVKGHYQDGSGFCLACPADTLAVVAQSGLVIALALFGVFVAVLCASASCAYRAKRRGGGVGGKAAVVSSLKDCPSNFCGTPDFTTKALRCTAAAWIFIAAQLLCNPMTGFQPTKEFVIWCLLALQIISQAGNVMSVVAFPEWIARTLRAVEIFNALEVRVMPPACYGELFCWSTPLCGAIVKLIVALVMWAAWCMMLHKKGRLDYWTEKCGGRCHAFAVKATPALRNVLVTLLSIGYPFVTNTAVRMVACRADETGNSVLVVDPHVSCYEPDDGSMHVTAAGLAWATLALYSVGFPALVFLRIRAALRREEEPFARNCEDCTPAGTHPHSLSLGGVAYDSHGQFMLNNPLRKSASTSAGGAASAKHPGPDAAAGGGEGGAGDRRSKQRSAHRETAYKHILHNDYARQYFWFRIVNYACLFVLSLTRYLLNDANNGGMQGARLGINLTALSLFALAIAKLRPYSDELAHAWKHPVKQYSLLLAAMISVLNYVRAQDLAAWYAARQEAANFVWADSVRPPPVLGGGAGDSGSGGAAAASPTPDALAAQGIPEPSGSVEALSYVVLLLMALFFVLLVAAYALVLAHDEKGGADGGESDGEGGEGCGGGGAKKGGGWRQGVAALMKLMRGTSFEEGDGADDRTLSTHQEIELAAMAKRAAGGKSPPRGKKQRSPREAEWVEMKTEAGDTYYFCEELEQTSWVKPASMNDGGRADRPEGLQVATSFDLNDPTAIPRRKRIMTVVSQI